MVQKRNIFFAIGLTAMISSDASAQSSSGTWSGGTTSQWPNPTSGSMETVHPSYSGSGSTTEYSLLTFNVGVTSTSYTFTLTPTVVPGPYMMVIVRGVFSPSTSTPTTLLTDLLYSLYNNTGSSSLVIPNVSLTGATQYSVVSYYAMGSSGSYTLTISGPGCVSFSSSCIIGPDATNTSDAMQTDAFALRSVLNRRLGGLAFMTDYDCQAFDKSGFCLSFQARYSNLDSMNEGAGVMTAAYRLNDAMRLGAFIDYSVAEKAPSNLKFSNDLPTFGLFAAYSSNSDGTGLQGKMLAALQKGDVSVTRSGDVALNTEPGSGKGSMNAHVIYGELGWGFAVAPQMVATPYAGLRYTSVIRGAYSEASVSGSVDYPITYDDYSQRLTTAIAGFRLSGKLAANFGYHIGAGVEHDVRQQTNSYSGTSSITGLTSFALATDGVNNRTRGVGSVSMYYQVEKNQRLTGKVSVRNQAYSGQAAVSVMAGYQLAF